MAKSNRHLIHALEKSKKHGETLQSELHTVLDAPPELVANQLEAAFGYDPYAIAFEMLNDDHHLFTIRYWNDDENETAEIKGVLRRWQGTQTRVDCDGDIKVPGMGSELGLHVAATLAVVGLVGGCMVLSADDIGGYLSRITPFLLGLSVVTFTMVRGWFLRDPFAKAQYAALKDLDKVLQRLTKTAVKLGVIHEERTNSREENLREMVRATYGAQTASLFELIRVAEAAKHADDQPQE
jgi:hypothetical protein